MPRFPPPPRVPEMCFGLPKGRILPCPLPPLSAGAAPRPSHPCCSKAAPGSQGDPRAPPEPQQQVGVSKLSPPPKSFSPREPVLGSVWEVFGGCRSSDPSPKQVLDGIKRGTELWLLLLVLFWVFVAVFCWLTSPCLGRRRGRTGSVVVLCRARTQPGQSCCIVCAGGCL